MYITNNSASLFPRSILSSTPHLQRAGEGGRVGADPGQPLGGAKVRDLNDAAVRVDQDVVALDVSVRSCMKIGISSVDS